MRPHGQNNQQYAILPQKYVFFLICHYVAIG